MYPYDRIQWDLRVNLRNFMMLVCDRLGSAFLAEDPTPSSPNSPLMINPDEAANARFRNVAIGPKALVSLKIPGECFMI